MHLTGIHKLKDIGLIQFWLDKTNKAVSLHTVIRQIKNTSFTDTMVKASHFYPDIKDRYENFSYDSLATFTYTDAVIHYISGQTIVKVDTFTLFEKDGSVIVSDSF